MSRLTTSPSHRSLATALVAALAAAAGCAAAPPTTTADDRVGDDASGGGPGKRCARQIYGVRDTAYELGGRTIAERPADARAFDLSVVTQAPSTGAWLTTPASYPTASVATVDAPCGPYLLEGLLTSQFTGATLPTYIATDAELVDLGGVQLGRADVRASSPGTSLALAVTGLDAWDPNDDLQLTSAGAGLGFSSLPSVLATPPDPGDTAIASAFDYTAVASQTAGGLIAGSRGDRAYLTQLALVPTQGDLFFELSLTRAAALPPFDMTDGATTPVTVALAPVPQQVASWSVHQDAFAALAASSGPGAYYIQGQSHIDTVPTGLDRQFNGGFEDLNVAAWLPDTGDLGLALGYGDPYPASWARIANLFAFYEVDTTVPTTDGSATVPYTAFAVTGAWNTLDAIGRDVGPTLGPAQEPRIDGADLFATATLATETPTLSWQPPALGRPDYYVVGITRLQIVDGAVNPVELAELETAATSITIPPGLLAAGSSYMLDIRAVAQAGSDLAVHPFTSAFVPQASADVVSAVLTR